LGLPLNLHNDSFVFVRTTQRII